MLSNGQFFINARATQRYGGLLAAINEGRVPLSSGGGLATPARLLCGIGAENLGTATVFVVLTMGPS